MSELNVTEVGNATPVILKEWIPTQRQNDVLRLPDTVFEALGGGAAGGGKTDLGIMIPPARQFTEHPKFKGLVMRRLATDLEKEIVPRQHEWYAPMGAVYNDTKKVWKFPSGARIQNGHAEREQDVRKYDSAEYNYIDWDESTHFTGFQYLYLSISRCRSSSPDLPAIVRAFTNPGNVGHAFFKERFVEPFPLGQRIIQDKKTGQKRIYVPFLGKDNPYLTKNDPGYLVRLEGLPEVEKKAKLYGDWNSYEGQVFSEFRVMRLADEPENAVHVIAPFEIPSWWPRILAIDWGWAAMTFAIWGAVSPDGRLYIYRTAAWVKTLIEVWSKDILTFTGDEVLEDVVVCHSANQHRGEPLTIREQIYNAFEGKYQIRLAEKDRIGGKKMIHEFLRWQQKPVVATHNMRYDQTLAGWILRNKGEESYNEYLQIFATVEEEKNIPRLQIFFRSLEGREAKELIDVIPMCIPDEHNPEDVAEFPGDDPYDALRAIVRAAHKFYDESKARMEQMEKIEKLNAIRTAQSQTAYYRELERLSESGESDDEIYTVAGHRRIGRGRR